MKKIFFLFALLVSGCGSSSLVTNYRFAGDDKLYSFEVVKEGSFSIDAILKIDGVSIDTIKGLHGTFKSSDEKSIQWKNKTIKFSALLSGLAWNLKYRILVNNELVAEQ